MVEVSKQAAATTPKEELRASKRNVVMDSKEVK